MTLPRNQFVAEWSKKLASGSASLFVGAGISIDAGYPSWKTLLADVARELGLDIDQEHDLAGVAQHYINRDRGRGRLTQLLADQFPPKRPSRKTRLIARLPLTRIWTTNWDELIEDALRNIRKHPDVKVSAGDLTYERPMTDVTLYKMHGSVQRMDDVVLSTDDFELYRIQREPFLRVLAGHLISTSFLFIGVSFTDPNLTHLLAAIREMYERYAPRGHSQSHYAVLRAPQEHDFAHDENPALCFRTACARHALFVEDLKRYNIFTVETSSYDELEDVLAEVEQTVAQGSVFVSGSIAAGALASNAEDYVKRVAFQAGKAVGNAGKQLITGYGLGVGDAVLSGTMSASWLQSASKLDGRVLVRPFPQLVPEGVDRDEYWAQYREDLVSQAGACIVVCGIRGKRDAAGDYETAAGVLREAEIAQSLGRIILPVGATGGAAQEIHTFMTANSKWFSQIKPDQVTLLGDPNSAPEAIGELLRDILKSL